MPRLKHSGSRVGLLIDGSIQNLWYESTYSLNDKKIYYFHSSVMNTSGDFPLSNWCFHQAGVSHSSHLTLLLKITLRLESPYWEMLGRWPPPAWEWLAANTDWYWGTKGCFSPPGETTLWYHHAPEQPVRSGFQLKPHLCRVSSLTLSCFPHSLIDFTWEQFQLTTCTKIPISGSALGKFLTNTNYKN